MRRLRATPSPRPSITDPNAQLAALPQQLSAAAPAAASDKFSVTQATGAAVPVSGLAVEIAATVQSGKTHFEVRLDPADLGRIDVRIDVDRNGQVTSHLTVEKPETLSMLQQDAPQLQQALNDAGLKTGSGGLQFSLRDQSQSGQNSDPNNNQTGGQPQRLVVTRGRHRPRRDRGTFLRPHAGRQRRRGHQGLRRLTWHTGATTAPSVVSGTTPPAEIVLIQLGRIDARLDRRPDHRGQFPDLPDAAHDAACRTRTRLIRWTPTSSPSNSCSSPASSSSSRPTTRSRRWSRCSRPRRRRRRCEFVGKTAIVDGNATAMSNSKATWELNVPSTSTININITNSTGQTVFTGTYSANAGDNQPFTWDGKGNDGTQYPDGLYKLTATAQDSTGNTVAISTQVGGTVSAVDLTQSPPMLSINGQSYTMSQIKAIGAGHFVILTISCLRRASARPTR